MDRPKIHTMIYMDGETVFEYIEEKYDRPDMRDRWMDYMGVSNGAYLHFPSIFDYLEYQGEYETPEMEKDIRAFYREFPEHAEEGITLHWWW